MADKTRIIFHQELNNLKKEISDMCDLVLDAVHLSVMSLVSQNPLMAKETMRHDHEIDWLELGIENRCNELLALQQPVAKDLRDIVTISKVLVNLDRLGDFAVNICQVTLATHTLPRVKILGLIAIMHQKVDKMVRTALKAFIEGDAKLAESLEGLDDEVDELFVKVIKKGIETMEEDPSSAEFTANLILVSKYLERMADHACNIAGRTIYMVTGKRKKIH